MWLLNEKERQTERSTIETVSVMTLIQSFSSTAVFQSKAGRAMII